MHVSFTPLTRVAILLDGVLRYILWGFIEYASGESVAGNGFLSGKLMNPEGASK